jgi:hypothetical protein
MSAAARSTELRPGDIIIAVISKGATTEVKTVEQFNKLLSQFEKAAISPAGSTRRNADLHHDQGAQWRELN